MSETLEVKIGASDAGLEATLKTVQSELARLETKIKGGDLSFKELDQTMRKIAQTEGLEKKLQAMGTDAAGTSPKIDALGGDLKAMGAKAEDAGEKGHMSLGKIGIAAGVAGAAVKVGMLAVEAAFAAANGVINAFGSAITQAADFQQLETSFNVLIGNTTLAKTFLEDLSNFAASTPFTIPGLADASKTLLSFGVMSSEVIPIVSMLGDVAQGNEEKLKSLALAFGKVESQGKLTGEELNQMIDSGFNPLDTISQKTGKSMGELRKEMEQGGITSQMVRDAFKDVTSEGGKFFEMTKKQGLTFKGVMSTMQDAVDELYRRFGKPVIEALTPIIQKWSERIAEIAPLFSEIGAAVANTITFFSDLVDKVLNVDTAVSNLSSSISAISGGEYAAGIENLFLSMKVWAMETGNEIYKYLGAAFTTAADFLVTTLGPSSAGFALLETGFSILAGKVKVELLGGIASAMEGMGPLFANGAKTAKYQMETAAKSVEMLTFGLGAQVELVQEQMTEAGAALPKSFSENYKDVPPLFNDIKSTQDQIDANNKKIAASTKVIVSTDEEAVAEAKAYFDQWKKSNALKEEAIARALEEKKIKSEALQFELDLATAKATGNQAEQKALEERKVWLDAWQKAVKEGLGDEQANAFADGMLRAKQITDSITGKDIIVTVTTTVEDKRWKTLLAEINSETATPHAIDVALKVTGQTDLIEARKILGLMENKNIEAAFKASGTDSLENLKLTLNSLPTKPQVDLAMKLTKTDNWDDALAQVKNIAPTKEVLLELKQQGFESVKAYKDSIEDLAKGRTAELTAKVMGAEYLDQAKAAVNGILESSKTPIDIKVDATQAKTEAEAVKSKVDAISTATPKIALDSSQASTTTSSVQNQIVALGSTVALSLNSAPADSTIGNLASGLNNLGTPVNLALDGSSASNAVASVKTDISTLGAQQKINLDGASAISSIRDDLKSGIELDVSAKSGVSGILEELKTLVSDIKTLVGKIEPKLPVAALTA